MAPRRVFTLLVLVAMFMHIVLPVLRPKIRRVGQALSVLTPFVLGTLLLSAVPSRADAAPEPVRYFAAAQVDAAFAKGAPIYETAAYKVHASRRDAAGLAEVHLYETDVIHVLQGSATFVTGGTVVEPKHTAAGEIRGRAISGGNMQQLKPGDVVIVPPDTPHWFQSVEAPFLYYVVKPISK